MTLPLKWVARVRGMCPTLAGLALHLHPLRGLALHPSCVVFSWVPPVRALGQSVVSSWTFHLQDRNQEACHVLSLRQCSKQEKMSSLSQDSTNSKALNQTCVESEIYWKETSQPVRSLSSLSRVSQSDTNTELITNSQRDSPAFVFVDLMAAKTTLQSATSSPSSFQTVSVFAILHSPSWWFYLCLDSPLIDVRNIVLPMVWPCWQASFSILSWDHEIHPLCMALLSLGNWRCLSTSWSVVRLTAWSLSFPVGKGLPWSTVVWHLQEWWIALPQGRCSDSNMNIIYASINLN